ncbi:Methyltransferase domain-containing protein [Streptoalloteichus tenebrarius]|uniref:Methyltransferase domain-containing protein n=1 Tax=Streptoalloteichus tenebrarius (strain ATCC 17920 / DSM 40477 / JCM 4838 / CBS 697.72 / NBRC 16177 / NCIMB 11028 / NRRL B-12390 / A12253. 1 / ISP 5477) TaxID=1933 RepID=A0ABT1HU82_STRSD|nr:Methyltransferase domain-containing protein [Streptoalloteichus tenebrarius]
MIDQALRSDLEGWDFDAFFAGRYTETPPSWDFAELVRARIPEVDSLLDLGTGGGELLASLAPLPARTAATEGFAPNVPVARANLEPLGVEVVDVTDEDEDHLPFPDGSFALVSSRHESYDPEEIRRVLAPGGTFLTQQVGGRDLEELNAALGAPPHGYREWTLDAAVAELEAADFEILDRREERPVATFTDVGAVVSFLRIAPWQVPDFDVDQYRDRLRELHERMDRDVPLEVHTHRFLIVARPRP